MRGLARHPGDGGPGALMMVWHMIPIPRQLWYGSWPWCLPRRSSPAQCRRQVAPRSPTKIHWHSLRRIVSRTKSIDSY